MLLQQRKAITFQSLTSAQSGSRVTYATGTYPSNIQAGDMLIWVCSNACPSYYDPPTGWTTLLNMSDRKDIGTTIFYRIASGGESGSVTSNWNSTAVLANGGATTNTPSANLNVMVRYALASTVRASNSANTSTSPSTTSSTPPTISTNSSELILHIYTAANDTSGSYNFTMGSPTNWTTRSNSVATASATTFVPGIVYSELAGGSTYPTITSSQTCGWAVASIALTASLVPQVVIEQNNSTIIHSVW